MSLLPSSAFPGRLPVQRACLDVAALFKLDWCRLFPGALEMRCLLSSSLVRLVKKLDMKLVAWDMKKSWKEIAPLIELNRKLRDVKLSTIQYTGTRVSEACQGLT